MTAGHRLCAVDEVPAADGRGTTLRDGDKLFRYVVLRDGETLRAYVNSCPHKGLPLDWVPDRFLSRDKRHIQCSSHGALFRIADGYCMKGPCAGKGLRPVAIRVEAGAILLDEALAD
ncbi:MAG: Rieske (2Fe-2S) protein [Alphaproteobacteria bacterium]